MVSLLTLIALAAVGGLFFFCLIMDITRAGALSPV